MKKSTVKKLVSGLTVLSLTASSLPFNVFAAGDLTGHWAAEYMSKLAGQNVLTGDPGGSFRPDDNIKRAEYITMLNNVFGFVEKDSKTFSDIKSTDWFLGQMQKAVAAGYLAGNEDGTATPDAPLTREDAFTFLWRAAKLAEGDTGKLNFKDNASIQTYAKAAVAKLVQDGVISGYPDGTINPKGSIKRSEAATIVSRFADDIYSTAGTYKGAEGKTFDSVVINKPDVKLQDMVIEGDLYIAPGVAEGDATFQNVTVEGTIFVQGGGVNTVKFTDCKLGDISVKKHDGKPVRLLFEGTTVVDDIEAASGVTIEAKSGVIIDVINMLKDIVANVKTEKGAVVSSMKAVSGFLLNGTKMAADKEVAVVASGVVSVDGKTTTSTGSGSSGGSGGSSSSGSGGSTDNNGIVKVKGISIEYASLAHTGSGTNLTSTVTPAVGEIIEVRAVIDPATSLTRVKFTSSDPSAIALQTYKQEKNRHVATYKVMKPLAGDVELLATSLGDNSKVATFVVKGTAPVNQADVTSVTATATGDSIVANAEFVAASGTAKFDLVDGTGATVKTQTPTIASNKATATFTTVENGTYTVKVTLPNGSTRTSSTVTVEETVVVDPAKTLKGTLTSDISIAEPNEQITPMLVYTLAEDYVDGSVKFEFDPAQIPFISSDIMTVSAAGAELYLDEGYTVEEDESSNVKAITVSDVNQTSGSAIEVSFTSLVGEEVPTITLSAIGDADPATSDVKKPSDKSVTSITVNVVVAPTVAEEAAQAIEDAISDTEIEVGQNILDMAKEIAGDEVTVTITEKNASVFDDTGKALIVAEGSQVTFSVVSIEDSADVSTATVTVTVTEAAPIKEVTKVSVVDITAPKYDEAITTNTAPGVLDTAEYTLNYKWDTFNTPAEEKFLADKEYVLAVTVKAKTGHELKIPTEITSNAALTVVTAQALAAEELTFGLKYPKTEAAPVVNTAVQEAAKITPAVITGIGTLQINDNILTKVQALNLLSSGYTIALETIEDTTVISTPAGLALKGGTSKVVFKVVGTSPTDSANTAELTVNVAPAVIITSQAQLKANMITAQAIGVLQVGDNVLDKARAIINDASFTVAMVTTSGLSVIDGTSGEVKKSGTESIVIRVTKTGATPADTATTAVLSFTIAPVVQGAVLITGASLVTITGHATDGTPGSIAHTEVNLNKAVTGLTAADFFMSLASGSTTAKEAAEANSATGKITITSVYVKPNTGNKVWVLRTASSGIAAGQHIAIAPATASTLLAGAGVVSTAVTAADVEALPRLSAASIPGKSTPATADKPVLLATTAIKVPTGDTDLYYTVQALTGFNSGNYFGPGGGNSGTASFTTPQYIQNGDSATLAAVNGVTYEVKESTATAAMLASGSVTGATISSTGNKIEGVVDATTYNLVVINGLGANNNKYLDVAGSTYGATATAITGAELKAIKLVKGVTYMVTMPNTASAAVLTYSAAAVTTPAVPAHSYKLAVAGATQAYMDVISGVEIAEGNVKQTIPRASLIFDGTNVYIPRAAITAAFPGVIASQQITVMAPNFAPILVGTIDGNNVVDTVAPVLSKAITTSATSYTRASDTVGHAFFKADENVTGAAGVGYFKKVGSASTAFTAAELAAGGTTTGTINTEIDVALTLGAGAQVASFKAVDTRGNVSNQIDIDIPAFVAPLAAGTYKVVTGVTEPAQPGDIMVNSGSFMVRNAANKVLTYAPGSANYEAISALITALGNGGAFAISGVNGQISSITKASGSPKLTLALQASNVVSGLIINGDYPGVKLTGALAGINIVLGASGVYELEGLTAHGTVGYSVAGTAVISVGAAAVSGSKLTVGATASTNLVTVNAATGAVVNIHGSATNVVINDVKLKTAKSGGEDIVVTATGFSKILDATLFTVDASERTTPVTLVLTGSTAVQALDLTGNATNKLTVTGDTAAATGVVTVKGGKVDVSDANVNPSAVVVNAATLETVVDLTVAPAMSITATQGTMTINTSTGATGTITTALADTSAHTGAIVKLHGVTIPGIATMTAKSTAGKVITFAGTAAGGTTLLPIVVAADAAVTGIVFGANYDYFITLNKVVPIDAALVVSGSKKVTITAGTALSTPLVVTLESGGGSSITTATAVPLTASAAKIGTGSSTHSISGTTSTATYTSTTNVVTYTGIAADQVLTIDVGA